MRKEYTCYVMYSNKAVLALFCKYGVIVMFSLRAPRMHTGHICDPTKSPKCISIFKKNVWVDILGNNQVQIPKIINIDQGEMSHA